MCEISKKLAYILQFHFDEGLSVTQAHKEICAVYGEDALSIETALRWFDRFHSGNFDVEDALDNCGPIVPKAAPTLRDVKHGRNTRSRKKRLKDSISSIKKEEQELVESNNGIVPEIKIEVGDTEYIAPDIGLDISSTVQIKEEIDSDSPFTERK